MRWQVREDLVPQIVDHELPKLKGESLPTMQSRLSGDG
jgi:hypothetical protein